ncbi:MAG: CDP-glycerol glycerophosphotransferase family protein [Bacteroidetes bacterium]|nr:CDP-glycerol glycerophosphotransferase family protein [Bacteroidota bacterium]
MNILFIGGSLNQTKMMHQISKFFPECNCYFSPYYTDDWLDFFVQRNMTNFTILGGNFRKQTESYLNRNNLNIDYQGRSRNYDLVFTGSDLIVPKNVRNKKMILVQEGMMEPINFAFYLTKYLKFPRWASNTAATGLSDYYTHFCVASEGFKELFIERGVNPDKIVVTGIPNFDNAKSFCNNNFPQKGYVLVATSDARETLKPENRKKFIKFAKEIAGNKQIIFKLHPNEIYKRAVKEIEKYAPGSLVFQNEDIDSMIANCDVLITKFSSVAFIGLALDKQVYSAFDMDFLKRLLPIQNGGTSSESIANVGRKVLGIME